MDHTKKLIFIFFIFFSLITTNVFAGNRDFQAKEGFYIGLSYENNSLPGEFDDSSYYTSATYGYNVPDVDSGSGFGITFGSRLQKGAAELSYHRSNHDTDTQFIDIGKQDSTYNLVDINLKIDVFDQGKLKPNILLGLGYSWLNIDNSMTDGIHYSDETFTGFAGNLGTGLTYYFNPRLCINGEVIYRWQSYGHIEGEEIDENIGGGGINYTVGIAYTF